MAQAARTNSYVSPQQYLALERAAEYKSEYYDGVVVAMSGASWEHNLLSTNIAHALMTRLHDADCSVLVSDMRVRVPECNRYYYPDVTVVCGKPEFEDSIFDGLLNPKIVIGVLSDSTERIDREDKFDCYQTIQTLTDYILVAQSHLRIEHFSRQQDGRRVVSVITSEDDSLVLPSLGIEVPAKDIYRRVKFGQGANTPANGRTNMN